jgi:hypothetical protein
MISQTASAAITRPLRLQGAPRTQGHPRGQSQHVPAQP